MNRSNLQIAGKVWTGHGPVRSIVVETNGERIARIIPLEQTQLRADAILLPPDTLMIPAFHDAHVHLLYGGMALGWCDASEAGSTEEMLAILEQYNRNRDADPSDWIQGTGLDDTRAPLTANDLDAVCPDTPVLIWYRDLHSAVANSEALKQAGIHERVPDPEDGQFDKDQDGKLTGILRESAAYMVEQRIPEPTPKQARAALLRAQQHAFSLGIASVSSSVRAQRLRHYLDFASSSDQRIRINAWCVSEKFSFAQERFDQVYTPKFRFATFKGFADGALGSRTAAFWQPYQNFDSTGMALVGEGPLARFVRDAHREKYQIAIHAIGDRAVSICLDAYEMAGSTGNGPECRPRIEHVQHIRAQDLPRLAEMGIVASMQPVHLRSDMHLADVRLDFEQRKLTMACNSILQSGAAVCFGSDWPVATLDPLEGIRTAVHRQDEQGNPPDGWQPQERISVEDALRGYTSGAAYAAFWEKDAGTIEEGKLADFAILSRNILSDKSPALADARVIITIAGGVVVYRTDGL